MIIYATHKGGRYLPLAESLKIEPSNLRGLYVNLTNRCNCDCVFCLRQKKSMAKESSLWLEREPTVEEVKAELDAAPWQVVKEVVFCGFGEPTIRLAELLELLAYIKKIRPDMPTRLNTNGLGELYHGREIAADFENILDTASISLNAATAEKYAQFMKDQDYDEIADMLERVSHDGYSFVVYTEPEIIDGRILSFRVARMKDN